VAGSGQAIGRQKIKAIYPGKAYPKQDRACRKSFGLIKILCMPFFCAKKYGKGKNQVYDKIDAI